MEVQVLDSEIASVKPDRTWRWYYWLDPRIWIVAWCNRIRPNRGAWDTDEWRSGR